MLLPDDLKIEAQQAKLIKELKEEIRQKDAWFKYVVDRLNVIYVKDSDIIPEDLLKLVQDIDVELGQWETH